MKNPPDGHQLMFQFLFHKREEVKNELRQKIIKKNMTTSDTSKTDKEGNPVS